MMPMTALPCGKPSSTTWRCRFLAARRSSLGRHVQSSQSTLPCLDFGFQAWSSPCTTDKIVPRRAARLHGTVGAGAPGSPPPQSRHGVDTMSYENLVLGQSKDQEQKSAHQGRTGGRRWTWRTTTGCTPLWIAANAGQLPVVNLLLESQRKGTMRRPSHLRQTPMADQHGVEHGFPLVAQALLCAKADPNAAAADGMTPLRTALRTGTCSRRRRRC